MRKGLTLLTVVMLPALAAGCVSAYYAKPTADFKASTATATAALGDFYRSRNAVERDFYFARLVADPQLKLSPVSPDRPAQLGSRFDAEAIQARLDSLELIGVYGARLADLAASEGPAKFGDASVATGKKLSGLGETWKELTKRDPSVAKYVGPTSTLIGVIGELALESRVNAAVERAISQGDPAVRAVLDALADDLEPLFRLDETGRRERLVAAIVDYNERRTTKTPEQRRAMLADIAELAADFEIAVGTNPVALVDDIRAAEAAMVRFSQSRHQPSDLASLSGALETFAARSTRVAEAINQLRKKEK
jgi:hypothetical protein